MPFDSTSRPTKAIVIGPAGSGEGTIVSVSTPEPGIRAMPETSTTAPGTEMSRPSAVIQWRATQSDRHVHAIPAANVLLVKGRDDVLDRDGILA